MAAGRELDNRRWLRYNPEAAGNGTDSYCTLRLPIVLKSLNRRWSTVKLCPRCQVELKTDSVEGIAVDGCLECGGIWFEEKELTQVARAHQGALLEAEDHFVPHHPRRVRAGARGGKCPDCRQPLFTFELKHSHGILLDGCRVCKGIWVDHGELRAIWEKIQTHPTHRTSAAPPPRSRMAAIAGFLTKVRCPVCGEANPATALVCWRCQAVLKGRRGAMLCPHCNGRLVSQEWGELTLDRCQSCGGLWMNDQTLSHLLAEDPPPVPPDLSPSVVDQERFALLEVSPTSTPAASNRKVCPVCQQPLDEYEYAYSSGIVLHKCPSCRGVWLDSGQWDTLTRFLATQRA